MSAKGVKLSLQYYGSSRDCKVLVRACVRACVRVCVCSFLSRVGPRLPSVVRAVCHRFSLLGVWDFVWCLQKEQKVLGFGSHCLTQWCQRVVVQRCEMKHAAEDFTDRFISITNQWFVFCSRCTVSN